MEANKIRNTHNKIVEILNTNDLTKDELVATLGQLLIYSGEALTNKTIDIHEINLSDLEKEYYGNNKDNDIGLGLILNGASIMGTLNNKITGNEIAQGESNDDQVSTTTKIPQENSTTSS